MRDREPVELMLRSRCPEHFAKEKGRERDERSAFTSSDPKSDGSESHEVASSS